MLVTDIKATFLVGLAPHVPNESFAENLRAAVPGAATKLAAMKGFPEEQVAEQLHAALDQWLGELCP